MPARNTPAPRPPETPLLGLIRQHIREKGPLSVAAYMELALNYPDEGYYQKKEPFGPAGDFVTAPEISQMFGELCGLWLAAAWQQAGSPSPFRLVELGPGSGQLMADLIRATAKMPGFLDAADIHMVDSSQRLQAEQRTRLSDLDITWHQSLTTVPDGPLYLIANEVFDALPVHQLILTESGFAERVIDLDDEQHLVLQQVAAPAALIDMAAHLRRTTGEGDVDDIGTLVEVSPARQELVSEIAGRIGGSGGTAAIIDYGAFVDHATGDTLQAVQKHRHVPPLSAPGEADLTSHVDFRSLGHAAAAAGADIFGPVPQGTFLRTLGIEMRAATLLRGADAEQSETIRQALFRLTDASAMGELFKVLALSAPDTLPPPGFDAPTIRAQRRGKAGETAKPSG